MHIPRGPLSRLTAVTVAYCAVTGCGNVAEWPYVGSGRLVSSYGAGGTVAGRNISVQERLDAKLCRMTHFNAAFAAASFASSL